MSWNWPEDFVKEVGNQWMITEGKFTVTGSYLQDREELPGLWKCAFEWIAIVKHGEKIVENTLDAVRNT